MPMTWDAAADAKLLSAILKVYNVKTGAEGLKEVAAIMGPNCTAKACTHRIAKIRELAGAGSGGNGSPTKTKARTPSKPKTTPVKKTPKKNGDSSDISDSEDVAGATPATSRSKRAGTKRNYADLNGGDSDSESGAGDNSDDANYEGEQGEALSKKVKIEVGEDIGEGLRAGAEDANDYTF